MSESPDCPTTCPNRKANGLTVFGWTIDPLELILHACILLILGVPAVRKTANEDFDVEQALKWMGAIVGCSTLVRLSPTDRVNAYFNLTK